MSNGTLNAPPRPHTHAIPPRQTRPRAARRRRALVIVAATLAVGLAGSVLIWTLTRGAAPSTQQSVVSNGVSISLPADGASAVLVTGADAQLGVDAATMLASHDPDARSPLASMSKLITALVILDKYPLALGEEGPWLTYSEGDDVRYDEYDAIGAAAQPMPAGSAQSQREAIASMLVPSASNYASVLVSWFFGSDEKFAAAARAWLDENGLDDTNIVEPTGISEDNFSTPRDMLIVGSLASANPVIAEITSRPETTIADGSTVQNTNTLLGIDGVTGLKTGNLGPGTFALVYTATIADGVNVVGIRFGGESRESVAADVRATLASIRDAVSAG